MFEEIDLKKAVLQKIILPGLNKVHNVYMLRLDLIHGELHGNKYFKMKYNLIEAKKQKHDTLLTFGGAYSNHIHATAAAGKLFGFKTIGVIRGEEHLPLNPTLKFAVQKGMRLHYVSRGEYRNKTTYEFQNNLRQLFGNIFIIPEGGTNINAIKGCTEIPELISINYNCLCVASGTAGTLSGIAAGTKNENKVLGFAVLKNGGFLINNAKHLLNSFSNIEHNNWSINLDYHFGGYAKISYPLIKFIDEFQKINGIPLDPIYTGKMIYGIYDLFLQEYFNEQDSVIAIHTGGIQGAEGMKTKMEKILSNAKSK